MERAWLFSLVPLTIGVVFLAVGACGLRRAEALRRTGVTAAGRIVRHDVRRDDDGARYHHPVAAWTAQDGTACAYPSRLGRGSVEGRWAVGAAVTVRYDATDPGRFEIQGWDTKTVDRVFAAVGSLLTAGTLLALLVRLLTGLLAR
ncbi:DUF3592 domain-containing protein [Streptomyces sp. NBC_00704]|uniref:DUF3592 domain-containing protein n=1 Tax=Streptomyces sp. NBC_00704 TaxID=2975809 RepID=UPI002E329401|nr:DUF3592 domain-containing protein [Streptomyces sp. NBC_00704]